MELSMHYQWSHSTKENVHHPTVLNTKKGA
jgi:hypothetical protein